MKSSIDYKQILFFSIDAPFGDLDGQVLQRLDMAGVLVVLVSNRSAAEMYSVLRSCGAKLPFLFENGGGVVFPIDSMFSGSQYWKIPEGFLIPLAMPLAEVREQFEDLKRLFGGNLAVRVHDADSELAAHKRHFELMFSFAKAALPFESQFIASLTRGGLSVRAEGDVYLASRDIDKGVAVRFLTSLLNRQLRDDSTDPGFVSRKITTVAVGDDANDRSMLASVDLAFLLTGEGTISYETKGAQTSKVVFIRRSGGFSEVARRLLESDS